MKKIYNAFAAMLATFLIMSCFLACDPTIKVTPSEKEDTPEPVQTYTITYELNGGTNNTENPASYTNESETITLKAPAKDGYTFAGWFEKADFTGDTVTEIAKGSIGNKIFYAKWEIITYTITYNLNSGTNSADNPATYTVESETITLETPTKDGYTFAGWFETEDFTGNPISEITKGSTGDKIFYARWTKGLYSITYELNGGTNSAENLIQYTVEDDTITLKDPTKNGYTFEGWYETEEFTGDAVTTITKGSIGNKIFYAKWNAIPYTITYELNDGTNNTENPESYTVESETFTLEEPTKTGYTFAGWYETEDFTGNPISEITKGSTGDKIFYARWTKGLFKITYELNGGTNSAENLIQYTVEDDTITLKDPTKNGYTFAGWYENADFTGAAVAEITKGTTGNKTFYAKWEIITYTITYTLNDGTNSADNPATYTVESETITLEDPTKNGYTFAGWYEKADFSGDAATGITKGTTGDKTFYAKWNAITYTITYELNEGTGGTDNPKSYTVENAITLEEPTKNGYTFAGWYEKADFSGDAVTGITKGTTGNKTFYAKWNAIAYTITYVLNDGTNSTENPASYTVESETISLKEPTKDGYTFAGWFEKADFSGDAATGITKGTTGNKTFYAKWNAIAYTITYVLNDGIGDTGNPKSYTVESAITLKEPTKNGYTFAGWFEKADFSGDAVTEIAKGSSGNKSFYAKWEYGIMATADDVAAKIESLKDFENGTYTIKVTGELTDTAAIKNALTTLQKNNPNVLVNLDLSGTTGLSSICQQAFFKCYSLASIEIPSSVTSIGAHAFNDCKNLASVNIPSSVTTIETDAFIYCLNIKEVHMESVKSWAEISFVTSKANPLYASSKAKLYISGTELSGNIVIPDGVTNIGNAAFYDCTSLASIEIPNSVTSIGEWAFSSCTGLESVNIPSGVTTIGKRAFNWCTSLVSIEIPSSVTSIEEGAFFNCTSLASITIKATTPPTLGIEVFSYNKSDRKIYVPKDSVATYKSKWYNFAYCIEAIPE